MKKTGSIILSLSMILSMIFSINASAQTSSDGWSYSDTVLTVTGNIPEFTYEDTPWQEYRHQIRTILIKEDTTEIAADTFKNLYNVKNVVITSELQTIGDNAFTGCERLHVIVIPDTVTSIGTGAFDSQVSVCVGAESAFANQDGYKTYTAGVAEDDKVGRNDLDDTSIGWEVYGGDTLVISGTGKMWNRWFGQDEGQMNSSQTDGIAPWKDYVGAIKNVLIDYGIENTTYYMLSSETTGGTAYSSLEKIIIGDTVEKIAQGITNNHTLKVTVYDLPYKLKSISANMMNGSNEKVIKELFISKTVASGAVGSIARLPGLTSLVIEEGFDGFKTAGTGDAWSSAGFIGFAKNLKDIIIPTSVTDIPKYTFTLMDGIEKFVVLNPETTIHDNALTARNNRLKSDNFAVVCYKDSTADVWAKKMGYPVRYINNIRRNADAVWIEDDNGNWVLVGKAESAEVNAENVSASDYNMLIESEVTVTYDFAGGDNYSKVIIAYDNEGTLVTIAEDMCTDEVNFTVPAIAQDKDIYAIVLPMSSNGKCGEAVKQLVGKGTPEFVTNIDLTVTDKINAEFEGTYIKSGSKDVLAVLCQLTEENELVAYEPKHKQFASEEPDNITFTDIALNVKADKVILYVWEGNDITNTSMVSLADCEVVSIRGISE